MENEDLMEHIRKNAKDIAKRTAFADIAEVLTTVTTSNILTPRFKRTLALSRTVEVDPEGPVDPNAPPTEDWELKYYPDKVQLSCVTDETLNMSFRYESGRGDNLFVDPETILASPQKDEDEDQYLGTPTPTPGPTPAPTPAATPGPSTAGLTPAPGAGGDAQAGPPPIILETPLRKTRVRFDEGTHSMLKEYINKVPEPIQPVVGKWTPSRGSPRTRAQHRAADLYRAALQKSAAETASPTPQHQPPTHRNLEYQTPLQPIPQVVTPQQTSALSTAITSLQSLSVSTTGPVSLSVSTTGPVAGGTQGAAVEQSAEAGAQGAAGVQQSAGGADVQQGAEAGAQGAAGVQQSTGGADVQQGAEAGAQGAAGVQKRRSPLRNFLAGTFTNFPFRKKKL